MSLFTFCLILTVVSLVVAIVFGLRWIKKRARPCWWLFCFYCTFALIANLASFNLWKHYDGALAVVLTAGAVAFLCLIGFAFSF
jgi:hypothetical protein